MSCEAWVHKINPTQGMYELLMGLINLNYTPVDITDERVVMCKRIGGEEWDEIVISHKRGGFKYLRRERHLVTGRATSFAKAREVAGIPEDWR